MKSVGNVKEMRSTAYEGGGFVLLEFEAGFDSKAALADVRAKVDQAKHDLPHDVDEPSVQEVNLSAYPVLVVGLAGDLPERTLLRIARSAKNAIEQVPGVLQAELRGSRDEAVEVIVEPTLLASYGIALDQLGQLTASFNTLIAAGALEGESGRFAVKVPSLFEKPQDVLKVPVTATAGAAVTLSDVAQIRPTFKDATSVTRVNGRPAMTIEVSKRTGSTSSRSSTRPRRWSRSCKRPGRRRSRSRSPRTSRRSSARCCPTSRTRCSPACCWSRS